MVQTAAARRVRQGILTLATLGWSAGRVLAAPGWYTDGTGGFNPQVPDFYQHQDWVTTGANEKSSNGWQSATGAPGGGAAGWCFQTAYADVFYDLAKQGYTNVYAGGTDPTTNPWYAAMYGADSTNANVVKSDIYQLNKNMGNIQTYLDNNVNNQAPVTRAVNPLPKLRSINWGTDGNTGTVTYQVPNGAGFKTVDTEYSIFDFSNEMIRDVGAEVLLNLGPGTASTTPNINDQSLWWTNFHEVAVAGLDVKNSTMFVADPDTNPTDPAGATGSDAAHGGWPTDTTNFPGAGPPVAGGSFGLKTPAGAGLPVPGGPVIGAPGSYDQNYADFKITNAGAGKQNYVTSMSASQYDNTVLKGVATITPELEKAAAAAPAGAGKEETAVSVTLPGDANAAVDGILIEPSSPTLDPTTNASLDSFSDPSEPSSVWADSQSTTDPFGNLLTDNGILYDLTSGNPLMPGESATIDIGTSGDFTGNGFDILLHFVGEPSNVWLPEMIGGNQLSVSDVAAEQDVPEPATLVVLLGLGAAGLGMRRPRRGAM